MTPTEQAARLRQLAAAQDSPFMSEALEAMARSWDNCRATPAPSQDDVPAYREYKLRCTEFALRDAEVFATLAVAEQVLGLRNDFMIKG